MRSECEALVRKEREGLVVLWRAEGRFLPELIVRPVELEMVLAILKNQIGATHIFGPYTKITKILLLQVPS